MITAEHLEFLAALEQNNNRAWFDDHRSQYKRLRGAFVDLLTELAEAVAFFDPAIRLRLGDPRLVKVFRINRDLRFSKDKRPYKTNFGGTIGAGDGRPLYYLSIQPDNSMAGGGLYMPPAGALKAIRRKIDTDYQDLQTILEDDAFRTAFPHGLTTDGALKTAPRGYSVDHPAIELLRLKSFAAVRQFDDQELVDDDFFDRVLTIFQATERLNSFLAAAVG